MLQALPLIFVLAGLALYTVLGGADFGSGFWQLVAARGPGGRSVREFAHRAMAPVWETNHVWLIFVLVVFWTAYPTAFGSIASTLAVPLFIALLGIVCRGAAYALREGATSDRESAGIDTAFALSSVLVPFALGASVGAIAIDRVPPGDAAGHQWSSWVNLPSILLGILAVTTSAYLAAVFLAADAAHDREQELERRFRRRALGAGVVAGALAIAGIFILDADHHALFHSLVSGRALPAVIVSGLAGIATVLLVYVRRYEPARYSAALAVAAIIAGWALSRWPSILPHLTVQGAAAGHDTLVSLIVAVLGGGVILAPALALLFKLTLSGRFRAAIRPVTEAGATRGVVGKVRLSGHLAVACLIAGFGLLNLANAAPAHAAGVGCLVGFIATGFYAIAVPALDEQALPGGRVND
jgi:cytochrome bd ubiquinol oxidase subunit II